MPEDNDATSTYGSTPEDSTGTYNSNLSGTYSYSDLREAEFKSKTHGIGVGDKIRLREKEFVITAIISEGTGEAVIYKVEDDRNKTFALKLYFEFSNPKEEPNGETLKRIKGITDPDILRLHDFGVGADKYQGRYCYEISDYAEGGDLFSVKDLKSKYNPRFIEQIIIPEIFKGIKKLHSHKIYHCDLKPSNIFYLDQKRTDIVIGDYGSGKAFDLETEKDGRKTSTVKGTELYLSPEQARGIISEKNDYYSFGVILLHLLYPESIASDSNLRQVNKQKLERVMERQYNSMPIIDYDAKHQRLNNLIEGLTLINHNNRWGRVEVEKWLKGEEVEVKYKTSKADSVQPIKLGYATIRTSKDFVSVLETNANGYEDLIEDPDTYTTVKSWLDSYRDVPTRKVLDGMVRFYQPLGKEYVKEALLRFFEPERPIRLDMHSFNFFTTADIRKEVELFISKLDEIWKHSSAKTREHLERLRFYLFQLEFSLHQVKDLSKKHNPAATAALIDKLYSVFGITQKSSNAFTTEIPAKIETKDETKTFWQLMRLFYTFNPDRAFKDTNNHSINTLGELALFFTRNEPAFSDKFLKAEKEHFLEKIGKGKLNELAYIPFIFEVFKNKAETEIELVDLSFDRQRNCKVRYKYYKSLNRFISQQGINKDLTSRSKRSELYRSRRGLLGSFDSECEKFIDAICETHNIKTLTTENLATIKTKFRHDSWMRYLYIYCASLLTTLNNLRNSKPKTSSVSALKDQEPIIQKKLHWKPAVLVALASFFVTLPLLFLFAVYMGWIPLDKNSRYLILTSAVSLDGEEYSEGDYLKVTNDGEFATCLENDSVERCYPTTSAASILRQAGNAPIDRFGTADYEFRQARKVFRLTRTTSLGGRRTFPVGSYIDVSTDDGQRYCFSLGNREQCYPRGQFADSIDSYGQIISNYRGRWLFTFNQDATINNVAYRRGISLEVARDSIWATCLKIPGGGERCYLKETAINRFNQPNVPVITSHGSIGERTMSVSRFGFGMAGFLAFLVAGLVFWKAAQIAKQVKLFFLHGEINTLEFKSL